MVLFEGLTTNIRDRNLQFRAIRGDLRHKDEVYDYFQDFSPSIADLFDNAVQAAYLEHKFPSFVEPGHSNHFLGTIFEDYYFRSVVFRSVFVLWLNDSFPERVHPTRQQLLSLLPTLKERLGNRWIPN